MMNEKMNAIDGVGAALAIGAGMGESCQAEGVYTFKCFEYEGGPLLWEDKIDNVVCTVGKNLMLQTALTGSAYTVTGPYMGLISSVSFTAVNAADTMTSHSGWLEAGSTNAPTFAARLAPSFGTASAGAISLTTPTSFTMTGNGTLQGAFITYGPGAVATLMNTSGTLLSAGVFTAGAQPVNSGNVVQVSYSLSL
ncbi:hypothetical protein UFOVP148_37 [uncultured Caudovirales phage]|uniref:Uncharacterized protein n=1 Tax=uncultured Caudovirales phage TaxID=2100421 RepID=A0A6J7WAI4_9CAUD|nr:hypothetical protein UFOVP148_37 [uncultured Caudovirales phage]